MSSQNTTLSPEIQQCSICQDNLKNPYTLPCGNVFCKSCIGSWLLNNNTCPLCRSSVPLAVSRDTTTGLQVAQHDPYDGLSYEELQRKLAEYSAMKASTERMIREKIGGDEGIARSMAFLDLLNQQMAVLVQRLLAMPRPGQSSRGSTDGQFRRILYARALLRPEPPRER